MELAFKAYLRLVLLEVCQFICASSVSTESLLCHSGVEGSQPYEFYQSLPDLFLMHPLPYYSQETQLLAYSLLGLRHEVF